MTYAMFRVQNVILAILQRDAVSRARAMTRTELGRRLKVFGIDLNDRHVREAYAALPVCSCDEGLFIPTTSEDLKEFARYLEPKVGPGLRDQKLWRLRLAYPSLVPAPAEIQQELPL